MFDLKITDKNIYTLDLSYVRKAVQAEGFQLEALLIIFALHGHALIRSISCKWGGGLERDLREPGTLVHVPRPKQLERRSPMMRVRACLRSSAIFEFWR